MHQHGKNVEHAAKREERNEEKICDLHLADLGWAAAAVLTLMFCEVWNRIFFCSELMNPIWRGKSKFYSERSKKILKGARDLGRYDELLLLLLLPAHSRLDRRRMWREGDGGLELRREGQKCWTLNNFMHCVVLSLHIIHPIVGELFSSFQAHFTLIARIALLFTATHTSLLSFLFLWAPSTLHFKPKRRKSHLASTIFSFFLLFLFRDFSFFQVALLAGRKVRKVIFFCYFK